MLYITLLLEILFVVIEHGRNASLARRFRLAIILLYNLRFGQIYDLILDELLVQNLVLLHFLAHALIKLVNQTSQQLSYPSQ